ncbi:hypothetical protein ACFTWF_36145 [Rhodococcus sp. NPDC056960]|uniref:hypothetical protein n=1 Tax=Rhodococcus TaxID=1827 RepID=UPI0036265F56
MTATIARDHIGNFIRRRGQHGYRTGHWAQILMTVPSDGRDCWLVVYQDGETDVVPALTHPDAYDFCLSPTDWRA